MYAVCLGVLMCIASCVSLCFLSTVDSGPSGGEGEVSLESVKALGLLVTGMDGSGMVRPLEELATLQSEAKAAGFSKVYTTTSKSSISGVACMRCSAVCD